MHCKFEEPRDTILSHAYSANSNSASSREPTLDLYKNSLETFIKIWKILLIAESNSEAEASAGRFLQIRIIQCYNFLLWTQVFAFCEMSTGFMAYLGETSLKNSQAWSRKSGDESKNPQLLQESSIRKEHRGSFRRLRTKILKAVSTHELHHIWQGQAMEPTLHMHWLHSVQQLLQLHAALQCPIVACLLH